MKTIKLIMALVAAVIVQANLNAQSFNWRQFDSTSVSYINLNTGFDFGLNYGAGYGHKLNTKLQVMMFGNIQLPAGKDAFDDFKFKAGVMTELIHLRKFSLTLKAAPIIRRTKTSFVTMNNIGADLGLVLGYYRPKFYIAAEFNYDLAVATNLKHSAAMKANYPDIQDGWYSITGRTFSQGIQTGFTLKKFDLYLKLGSISFNNDALVQLPYYAQLGLNFRL